MQVVVLPGADFHRRHKRNMEGLALGLGLGHAVHGVVIGQGVNTHPGFLRGNNHLLGGGGSVGKYRMGM